jgi:hypothetical protein
MYTVALAASIHFDGAAPTNASAQTTIKHVRVTSLKPRHHGEPSIAIQTRSELREAVATWRQHQFGLPRGSRSLALNWTG